MNKKIVAVLFGGQAVEHDISILTGLQIIEAMDTIKYEPLPIYVDQKGVWWHGAELLDRKNYHFSTTTKNKLKQLELPVGHVFSERPFFNIKNKTVFSKTKKLYFDIAFLAFHGEIGEDGLIQGIFEVTKIPYTGTRVLASAIFMNKVIAKGLFKSAGIPVLSEIVIKKPFGEGLDINKITANLKVEFPVCVKPCNLGSSIGVYKAENQIELNTAILGVFKIDKEVLIEPFVENLVEYNVAVTKAVDETTMLSIIERPIKEGFLLSFKDKYLSQGGIESKLSAASSTDGMVSATRELSPEGLTATQKQIISESAKKAFELVSGCGAPRMDFLCNGKTGEIWLNEVNPLPGSIGYFLWEARTPKIHFTMLIDALIQEGFIEHNKAYKTFNLKDAQSSIFPVRD